MCVIAICKKRKLTAEEIDNCNRANDDGIGIGWFEGERVHYIKGMEVGEFKRMYEKFRVRPHVVHFRLASAGEVIPALTHPFIISKDAPNPLKWSGKLPILFHNGTVTRATWESMLLNMFITLKKPLPDGEWSDTRAVATIVSVLGKNALKMFSGKWVYILPNGKIYYVGDFKEHRGVLFSNDSYKRVTTRYVRNGKVYQSEFPYYDRGGYWMKKGD